MAAIGRPWKRKRGENRARYSTIFRWSLRFLAQCACVPLLVGCATGTLDCTDLRQGACKVSFQRFLTDTSATFTGPEGLGFAYNSSPNDAALAELASAVRTLALRVPRAEPFPQLPPGRPPTPLVPPFDPDEDAPLPQLEAPEP